MQRGTIYKNCEGYEEGAVMYDDCSNKYGVYIRLIFTKFPTAFGQKMITTPLNTKRAIIHGMIYGDKIKIGIPP